MASKQITIKDIAKMANVSPGTVDRVIHNRGKVSDKAMAKVSVILEEIQYKPNVFAQSLKKQTSLRMAALVPYHSSDGFWSKAYEGIQKAFVDFEHLGVSIEIEEFNNKDVNDFVKKARTILAENPNGLLITPVFLKESLEVLKEFESSEIPFVTFNTFIPELSSKSAIGQDLKQSGRLAASLIDQCRSDISNVLVIHLGENPGNAPHMMEKESGFREYFKESNPSIRIQSIEIPQMDQETINRILNKWSGDLRSVSGAYVTTAGAHHVAFTIKSRFEDSLVIGYDLIEENINGLKAGTIDFLINQNPFQSAYEGVSKLVDLLVFDKEVDKRMLMPLDIVNKENAAAYLNK